MLVVSFVAGSSNVAMDRPVSMSAMEPAKFTTAIQILAPKPISSPAIAAFMTITADADPDSGRGVIHPDIRRYIYKAGYSYEYQQKIFKIIY